MRAEFLVEEAGCQSCAARVRDALAGIARVEAVEIDEEADTALVRVVADEISQCQIEVALEMASSRSGHEYRVRQGSWSEP